jgi:hypothetical protein
MHWETLDEAIKVRADFAAGEVTPLLFRRAGCAIRIVAINSRWAQRRGRRQRHYFSVTAESGDIYQLRFDPDRATWKAEAVMHPG